MLFTVPVGYNPAGLSHVYIQERRSVFKITQARWRLAGTVCILLCGAMAFAGVSVDWVNTWLRSDLRNFFIYWAIFFFLFLAAIYLALLDFRYIRAQYAIARREVFQQTLGEEAFRKALLAKKEAKKQTKEEKEDESSL